jgi:hypothetical protein
MKNLKIFCLLAFVGLVAGGSGCKKSQEVPQPSCIEGVVIGNDNGKTCRYVVQILNREIGVEYREGKKKYTNCVVIDELTPEYYIVGKKVYFTEFTIIDENAYCATTNYFTDIPKLRISVSNLYSTKCNN